MSRILVAIAVLTVIYLFSALDLVKVEEKISLDYNKLHVILKSVSIERTTNENVPMLKPKTKHGR